VQATNVSVSIRQAGPISLVDVSGRLTFFEVGALRDSISRLLKPGRKNIVLNLSGLQYLDSSGIGELAKIYVSVVKVRIPGDGDQRFPNDRDRDSWMIVISVPTEGDQ